MSGIDPARRSCDARFLFALLVRDKIESDA